MTRIMHVLDHSLPMHSGYTFRTRAILKAQQAAGLTVRGMTGLRHSEAGPDIEEADGLVFHRTRGKVGRLPLLAEWQETSALADAIVACACEWRPDILHAHSPALNGLAALRASGRLGIPLVYEIRAFWEDAAVGNGTGREGSFKYRLTRAVEDYIVARAGHVVTICEGLRDDLVQRGHSRNRIAIMPNGVDLDLFGSPVARDPELAEKLDLGEGPVIGFIGSFYDYEGLDDLVAAMPTLLEYQPDARLLLVGGGPMADAIRRQAQASPARAAIRFVGRVPHHEVERYYALTDIMAYPRKASRLTDLVTPLKPLEAMAQGKLVAASDVGGHRELMTDRVTGTLFPPDDPAAIAQALANLISNRESWEAMRSAGRRHVEQHHDWSRNVHRYQPVYQSLLSQSPNVSRIPAAMALSGDAKAVKQRG